MISASRCIAYSLDYINKIRPITFAFVLIAIIFIHVINMIVLGVTDNRQNPNRPPIMTHSKLGQKHTMEYTLGKERLPGAIIIGVPFCGANVLLYYLSAHPDVSASYTDEPKSEVNFFSQNYEEGLEWYRRQMPPSLANQLTIEKSAEYFYYSNVPERIKHMNSSIKLVLVVCDPVRRFIRQYANERDNLANGKRIAAIEQIATVGRSGKIDEDSDKVEVGCFSNYIGPWLKSFTLPQLYIVDGDKLRKDPFPEVKSVEEFLGLSKRFTKDHFAKTKDSYVCVKMDGVDQCRGDAELGKARIKSSIENKLEQFYSKCNKAFTKAVSRKFTWTQ